jgi:RimJ/RimL family protein N-acetyltransferase
VKIKFTGETEFFLTNALTDEESAAALEYTETDFSESGTQTAFAYSHGCIIIRYYEKKCGYYFSPPYPLSDTADPAEAFKAISLYCTLEGIPEVIVDVLEEELELVLRGALHYDTDKLSDGTYAVTVYNECMLLDELPEATAGEISLTELNRTYARDYEKLIKNANLNVHFGYSYCDDMPDGKGMDFVRMAKKDFERGESVTLGATALIGGKRRLVGEGCIYGFDCRGTASVSFRVLPDYHRRGFGSSIFDGLRHISRVMGLRRIVCDVKRENSASVALLRRYKEPAEENESTLRFVFNLQ